MECSRYRVYILYQRADDPFRIKRVGTSEASPTPCNYTKLMKGGGNHKYLLGSKLT